MKSFKGLISKIQDKSKDLAKGDKLKKKLKKLGTPGQLFTFSWW